MHLVLQIIYCAWILIFMLDYNIHHFSKTAFMKIILVGASGTIGQKVYNKLSARHEVIKASVNAAYVFQSLRG